MFLNRTATLTLFITLVLAQFISMAAQAEDLRLEAGVIPAASRETLKDHKPRAHILSDSEWFTWGCSVIRDEDNKYHMFYARWPRAYSFTSWLTHSEVAHAVAERPEGPYRFVETAVRARGKDHWDQFTAHNPVSYTHLRAHET